MTTPTWGHIMECYSTVGKWVLSHCSYMQSNSKVEYINSSWTTMLWERSMEYSVYIAKGVNTPFIDYSIVQQWNWTLLSLYMYIQSIPWYVPMGWGYKIYSPNQQCTWKYIGKWAVISSRVYSQRSVIWHAKQTVWSGVPVTCEML